MRWTVNRTNPEFIEYLSRASGISPALAQIMVARGIKTPEEVGAFMAPDTPLSDPLAIDGIGPMVESIERARKDGTRILVHGDYDADGVTATAIMVEALRNSGLEVEYFVPSRFKDGYGFHPPAVEMAAGQGAGLIVTVDCGITSHDAVEAANARGLEVLITDHHEPNRDPATGKPVLPPAKVIVNPKVAGAGAMELSGAGLALKVAQALELRGDAGGPNDFMALAALGTVADSVPLTGENRTIVRDGLEDIVAGKRIGIAALKAASGLGTRTLAAGLMAFTMVPRINAAGRLADATEVVKMFLTNDEDEAERIAKSLSEKNSERQKIEEGVLKEALAQAEQNGVGEAIVLAGEGWHEGVLGIVASRVSEKYSRPAFILSIKDGVAKGSARSVPGFDVHDGLSRCAELLIGFGGHKQAAGLRLKTTQLEQFSQAISDIAQQCAVDFTPVLNLDAQVELKEVNFKLLKELEALEPFGYGNPDPVFGAKSLEVVNSRIVGNNHLKLKLRSHNCALDAIGWGMGGQLEMVEDSGQVDVAFAATINEYNGNRMVQMKLKAIRPTAD